MILTRKPGRPDQQRSPARFRRFGNPDDVFARTSPRAGSSPAGGCRHTAGSDSNAAGLRRRTYKPGGGAASTRRHRRRSRGKPRGNGNRKTENRRAGGAFRDKFGTPPAQRRDIEGAISQFRAAISSSPNYAAAHLELGMALRQQGHLEEAQKEFQKAASLDPS